MRSLSLILFIVLHAPMAMAQQYYAEQTYSPPQTAPQQVSGNYYVAPTYAPSQPVQVQPPQHVAPTVQQPQPLQSVTTDIRQMNF